MKTPEEIKKGLAVCATLDGDCENCPYDDRTQLMCVDRLRKDSLSHIQRLESAAEFYRSKAEMLESRLAQVERERDALNHDLTACFVRPTKMCRVCANVKTTICNMCERGDCFKWRGVCAENTKEE